MAARRIPASSWCAPALLSLFLRPARAGSRTSSLPTSARRARAQGLLRYSKMRQENYYFPDPDREGWFKVKWLNEYMGFERDYVERLCENSRPRASAATS